MRLFKRKAVVVVMALAMVIGTSATAFAWWSSSGTGDGTAPVANPGVSNITVNQDPMTGELFPGGDAVVLSGDFDNLTGDAVHVHQVTATLAKVTGGGTVGTLDACTIADFTLDTATVTVDDEIEPGSGVGDWSGIAVRMVDRDANQDNCKGASVVISYTSS